MSTVDLASNPRWPATLFSDESWSPTSPFYVRTALVCVESDLPPMRCLVHLVRRRLFTLIPDMCERGEIVGDIVWQHRDEPDVATAVSQITAQLAPRGPIFPVVFGVSTHMSSLEKLARSTCVPWDAVHVLCRREGQWEGVRVAAALSWQYILGVFQQLANKLQCQVGYTILDNFAGYTDRLLFKIVNDRLGGRLRGLHAQTYIPDAMFIPSKLDTMIQFADLVAYFMRMSFTGNDSDLAAAVRTGRQHTLDTFHLDIVRKPS